MTPYIHPDKQGLSEALYIMLPLRRSLKDLEKIVELNQEWGQRVVDQWEDIAIMDIHHDLNGLEKNDEHFLPRI